MNNLLSRGLFFLVTGTAGTLLAATLFSCSSKDEAVGATDYATLTADAYCGALQGCCGVQKLSFDSASCHAQVQFEVQGMLDSTKRGKVVFDGNIGKQCQDALKSRVGQCLSQGDDAGAGTGTADPLSEVCKKVFVGTVALGGQCGTDLDCKTTEANESGVCRVDDRKDADPDKKICFTHAIKVPKGGDCTIGLPKSDFTQRDCVGYCDTQVGRDGQHGKCQDAANVGDTCVDTSTPGKVSYRVCRKGGYCSPTSRKCVAAPVVGRDCAQGYTAITGALGRFCAADLFCKPDGQGGPGTCAELAGTGESCKQNDDCFSSVCDFTAGDDSDGGTGDSGVGTAGAAGAGKCASPVNVVKPDEISKPYEVSARTCAFGPNAIGPVNQGPVTKSAGLRIFR